MCEVLKTMETKKRENEQEQCFNKSKAMKHKTKKENNKENHLDNRILKKMTKKIENPRQMIPRLKLKQLQKEKARQNVQKMHSINSIKSVALQPLSCKSH